MGISSEHLAKISSLAELLMPLPRWVMPKSGGERVGCFVHWSSCLLLKHIFYILSIYIYIPAGKPT